jgi:hypothetical protein
MRHVPLCAQCRFLVVHDHVSVPADLEHGQALRNLTP